MTARGFNIDTDNLLLGVGAALHYNNKEDKQSVELQELIKEKGIKNTLAEIAKLPNNNDILDKVEYYYNEVESIIANQEYQNFVKVIVYGKEKVIKQFIKLI